MYKSTRYRVNTVNRFVTVSTAVRTLRRYTEISTPSHSSAARKRRWSNYSVPVSAHCQPFNICQQCAMLISRRRIIVGKFETMELKIANWRRNVNYSNIRKRVRYIQENACLTSCTCQSMDYELFQIIGENFQRLKQNAKQRAVWLSWLMFNGLRKFERKFKFLGARRSPAVGSCETQHQ